MNNITLVEAETRKLIDDKLVAAGWVVQDKARLNLTESLGVAVREMDTNTGPADYMLFIDGKACGIIEAKREGTNLVQAAEQSARYAVSTVKFIQRWVPEDQPLPFLFEATNHEIRFRDERDPHPRSRNIFHFHKPETLKAWLEEGDTLRARMQQLPELDLHNLRACQIDAVHGIEHSLKQGKPRALLQMATGSGKTYTAVTEVYRLAKFARVKRVLFLVDRGNLATNAKDEFEQFVIPHDGRKFTQHYNVNILGRAGIPDATKVTGAKRRKYLMNPEGVLKCTISTNKCVVLDKFAESKFGHTSVRRAAGRAMDGAQQYFDAFLIGLTATPTKKTIGFFGQNLVSEYTHEDAVVDEVNVGYDIYRITNSSGTNLVALQCAPKGRAPGMARDKTELTEQGNTIEAGTAVEIRERAFLRQKATNVAVLNSKVLLGCLTKQKRLEVLDSQEEWLAQQLDRSVLAPNQIRTVIQAYKDRCLKECFPERNWNEDKMEWVPKTLVFAKDDDHCDRIVDAVREVFDEGNAFCKKITYKVGKKTAEESIKAFRTDPQYRIAVTVDLIATGTDIRPLECVMFMRDVTGAQFRKSLMKPEGVLKGKSQSYYEQMKGRGTRIISRAVFGNKLTLHNLIGI